MYKQIVQYAEELYPQMTELRRHFHRYPELSRQEYRTQAHLIERLSSLGIESHKIADTGVIAEIKGARAGRTIALRADMDALAMDDLIDKPYRSLLTGAAHTCGHDAHMAIVWGAAAILKRLEKKLSGTIRLLFQPAEEPIPGGAPSMIEDGALEGVDAILATHVWQPIPCGLVGISEDRMMARTDAFTITIHGKGGHGSMPHQAVDSILIGSQIVSALHTITSRSIDPRESAALSVCTFQAGSGSSNILPDTAMLRGTLRTFDDAVREEAIRRIHEIAEHIAAANRASVTVETVFGCAAVRNDRGCARIVKASAEDILGQEHVHIIPPAMASEDFSFYLEKVPGVYFLTGAGNPDIGCVYPQHHPKYDIDETCMLYAVKAMTAAALRLADPNTKID